MRGVKGKGRCTLGLTRIVGNFYMRKIRKINVLKIKGLSHRVMTPLDHCGENIMQAEKWVVGVEYVEVAFARLKRALSDL